jgi:hypothetical protein
MPSNRSRRGFAVRAWIALGTALFLVSSVASAADAPGAVPVAARVTAPLAASSPALAAEQRTARDATVADGLEALRGARAVAAQADGAQAQSNAPAAGSSGSSSRSSAPAAPRTYRGTNHLWYPALGINQPVGWFACDSPNAPGPLVYRWGCAGANNVYLLAHAGGKFQPIYNAYYAHRLKTGQLVVYADGKGHVHYYKLAWYKVTPPLASSHWAWDPQPVSSLTLQTCLGSHSELRLFVRFVEVAAP